MASDTPHGHFELEPEHIGWDGSVTSAGAEVFIRGIGNRVLGIGRYAGELVLGEASGSKDYIPILEVQGSLVSGGQVDLWSSDPALIAAHRDETVYPIGPYLAELKANDKTIAHLIDAALAAEMGVRL